MEEMYHVFSFIDIVLRKLPLDKNQWACVTFSGWLNINYKFFQNKEEKMFFHLSSALFKSANKIDLILLLAARWRGDNTLLVSKTLDLSGIMDIC